MKLNTLFIAKSFLRSVGFITFLFFITSHSAQAQFTTPDDEIPFSEEQNNQAAKVFVTEQEKVLKDVFFLAEKLEEKKQSLLFSLGEKRIQEIKNAQNLPETNKFEKMRKQQRLTKLGAASFGPLKDLTEGDIAMMGEAIYRQRSINGEKIEELRVEIAGLGKAEPTSIDENVFTRIVHEEGGIAFLLLPNELTFDSKHLQKYIARVRYLSNFGKGRPVVLLSRHHSSLESENSTNLKYKFYDTPKTWKEKIKTWWHANYEAPNSSAVVITAMAVLFQVATTEGISAAQYALGNTQTWEHSSSYLTAAFGTVFGLWFSFYNNITASRDPLDLKSRRVAWLKRMLISSASFAYSLQIMNHGVDSVSLMTTGGWLANLALWGNIITNNAVKDQYKLFSDIREDMGLNRGTVDVLGVKVKKNPLNRTLVEQVSRSFKMIDLMKLSVLSIPVGSFLFYSSYIWTQYVVLKYAEKMNYDKKDRLKEQWKNFTHLPYRPAEIIDETTSQFGFNLAEYGPKAMIQAGWDMTKEVTSRFVTSCASILNHQSNDTLDVDTKSLPFKPSADGEWMEAATATH